MKYNLKEQIYSIREAEKKDQKAVQRFIELVDNDFYPPLSERGGGIPERVQKCLDTPEANYLIAGLNEVDPSDPLDGMIGCTKNWKSKGSAYVNFLATHPDYRNLGVSKELTGKFEEKLKKKEFKKIYLCTWSSNQAAIKFYENLEYKACSIVLNHRGKDVHTIYYIKKI
ncbi:MAG: GNAT family N-acetyltransferase [Methanolobus sp.]